ncbi:MAG: hypothetical protein FWH41_02835, partial [Treponema sp.]|nr:hypothetical protein [Treponema sp.]
KISDFGAPYGVCRVKNAQKRCFFAFFSLERAKPDKLLAPGLLEDIDPNTPYFNSPDEVPEMSEGELAALEATGTVSEIYDMTFGDPADLSNVETIFEVYQDIEINNTPEHLFRLLLR